MALSVYPQDSSKNLTSKSPPPQLINDSKPRARGNSAAARPSLRLHIANPTERLPVADTQTRALYNVPADPNPADLRHRGASFGTGKRSPSPQVRISNQTSGNSTPSSSSAGSATSGRGTTLPGRHQAPPQQMYSAGTVTTATTDELSGFSAFPSNISTPATNDSAHSFGAGPGNKNRSRPLPLPPPPSRPSSRGSTIPEARHGKGGPQPQQLTFDPTTSTWVIKPSVINSPLRSAPPNKLTASVTSPQLLGAQSGYSHQQSRLHHHSSSRSHGHSRSRSDQSRELTSLPKPMSIGSASADVSKSRSRQQSTRTAPSSDNESEALGSNWKQKQFAETRHDSDSPAETTEEEPELDPERLPGGKKWKGKEPIRGEGWHLLFPNASKNSSGLSVHTPPAPASAAATPPPALSATAPLPSTPFSGTAASSRTSLDLPPSISKSTATTPVTSFVPADGRPQSISSISISSRESRDEGTTRWKSKGRDGIRRSGSVSSISSYNSISGVSARISKKSSKRGKGKGKGKNVVGSASISYHNSAYGGPNGNLGASLSSPYIPTATTAESASTAAAAITTPTPVTVLPLPSAAPTPRSTQTLHQHPVDITPDRTFTPSRNLPAEPVASTGAPLLPLPPSLQIGGGILGQKSPPVPPKDMSSAQARAMANDPFSSSYTPGNQSPDNTNANPHLLYVYREYRDTDSDSLSSSQHDPVDIGYGYGDTGFEDDERVYVDDGYSGHNPDQGDWDEEDHEGGFITAAGTYVEGGGTGSNSDLNSALHGSGSSVYHGSTVHGSNIAHSVRSGVMAGRAAVSDIGGFRTPSLNEKERDRDRSPSPLSFAKRRKNSLDFLDDDDDLRDEDPEDDELSPDGTTGGAGYDMQGFGGDGGVPVAAPIPRRPGVSVTVMEQEFANAGMVIHDWRPQVQETIPALPSSGTGPRPDILSPASPRGARQRPTQKEKEKGSTPATPAGGLVVDIDPAEILGPEHEMIFSKNPSPTRYGGGYRSPFTFGGDEKVFVRGRWRMRSPSPNLSPLDLGPDAQGGHGLSPASGSSAPLSPITFTTSAGSGSNTLSPLSNPTSPIRRQRTGTTGGGATLGANLGATARKLRRYASEESLLIDSPNPVSAYNKASYNNFNNSNYDSSYYNNYNHSTAPMRLAPNRYVEPQPQPQRNLIDDFEGVNGSLAAAGERSMRRGDRSGQSGNGSGSDSSSIGGRSKGQSVTKVVQSMQPNHGSVLTKPRRPPHPAEKVSYDLWVQGLENKGKRA
ncbi:hypothetical protein D9758_009298 [Tetrapyrgos nigripes]|uniref:Uncharacterized protein n=1 Tax=Tetrapyrgos nigripes TaxID=182062 RepID=A0A8H5GGQ7_9AGAR|nr:hypothetical protein D9758_009298 [Tetrapyrgos nigripes]